MSNATVNFNLKLQTGVNQEPGWFISNKDIKPGGSAVLGNKSLVFYTVHTISLLLIVISIVSSLAVVSNICTKWRRAKNKIDFPMRFPLYLAIADLLWGVSHFFDHLWLITTFTYPTSISSSILFGVNLWFFFGYQQLMHLSVAGYVYCCVVHQKGLNLGKWEWKLHLFIVGGMLLSLAVFLPLGAFGNSGYWMFNDTTTVSGKTIGSLATVMCTLNAGWTAFSYQQIKHTVEVSKEKLCGSRSKVDSVASQCLTTYVCIAAWLYCPMATFAWVHVLLTIFWNIMEPISTILFVATVNSSGWANAYGYFYNERLKKEKKQQKGQSCSSGSTIIKSTSE